MEIYKRMRVELVSELEKLQKALVVLDEVFKDTPPKRGRPTNLEREIRAAVASKQ